MTSTFATFNVCVFIGIDIWNTMCFSSVSYTQKNTILGKAFKENTNNQQKKVYKTIQKLFMICIVRKKKLFWAFSKLQRIYFNYNQILPLRDQNTQKLLRY